MQWTIDPRKIEASDAVCAKAIRVFEANPRVIVRVSRRIIRVPSSTTEDRWATGLTPWDKAYNVVIAAAPDGWKATCQCDSTGWCHHGYAAALYLADADGLEIPVPRPPTPRKTKRSRSLTVIPGGKAS